MRFSLTGHHFTLGTKGPTGCDCRDEIRFGFCFLGLYQVFLGQYNWRWSSKLKILCQIDDILWNLKNVGMIGENNSCVVHSVGKKLNDIFSLDFLYSRNSTDVP